MSKRDYDEASSADKHASSRDRKRDKGIVSRLMRGNRSIFEIQKAVVKRGRKAREKDLT